MLEKEDKVTHQRIPTIYTMKNMSSRGMEEHMLALSQRMTFIEESLTSKVSVSYIQIDRNYCMLLLYTKVNMSNFGKISDYINAKFVNYQKILYEKIGNAKRNGRSSLSKPKGFKKEIRRPSSSKKNILLMKPQYLHLESNETMFSLVVEQIEYLKKYIKIIYDKLYHKGKVNNSLSNEICQKIQNLEKELRQSVKMSRHVTYPESLYSDTSCWSQLYYTKSLKLKYSSQISKKSLHNKQFSSLFETGHLNRKLYEIQKDLSSKMSIKDISILLKNNMEPFHEKLYHVKNFTTEAIENTKKILSNQSEINQYLLTVSKIGWWISFYENTGLALWNKEIANMDPDCFICEKYSDSIFVTKKGYYLFKVLCVGAKSPSFVYVGGKEVEIEHESLIYVEANTTIQVPSYGNYLFFSIQKI